MDSLEALVSKIERAFGWRAMPAEAIDRASILQFDSDVEDADWFSGKDWREITLKDWQGHSEAYIFMSNDAAVYYLQNLLIVSAQNPGGWSFGVDSLLHQLDWTPEFGAKDDWIRARYLGWKNEEYEALQEWLLFMSEHAPDLGVRNSGPGDSYGRAFELIELLKQETIRLSLP